MHKFLLVSLTMILALPLVAQIQLDDKPRRYLSIKVEGASKDWDVRPIRITDRVGGNLNGASSADLKSNLERWERTGYPKRYNIESWQKAFDGFLGANGRAEGAKFWFYLVSPKKPHPEGIATVVDERNGHFWAPASKVTVLEYPATWLNLFEGYVARQEGEARQAAVKEWESAHTDIIENLDDKPDGFTQEERNEFATFYQEQFVYIRDRNPTLPSIYDELASFHAARNNLDAELSVYLAALRSGVASPDYERFALQVGRITFTRLQLWEEAEWALRKCQNYSEARYLLAQSLIELDRFDEARRLLNDLVTLLGSDETLELELSAEEELGRAYLVLAKLAFKLSDFKAAEAALSMIPDSSESRDAGLVLTCAMLLHRNRSATSAVNADGKSVNIEADAAKIRKIIPTLSFWVEAQGYASPKAVDFPLNSLMAEAMVIYAQTDASFTRNSRGRKKNLSKSEGLRFLNAAMALDPLSAEAYVALGRLYKIQGMFRESMLEFQKGLEVDPRNVMAHFQLADLHMKAGMFAIAKDHLAKCLKYESSFYAAQTMLGELAMADVDHIERDVLIKISAGEAVDYGAELVLPMKEAAAFFSTSLQANPLQPQTKLALATLYLRLSEVAPLTIADTDDRNEVKKAYLIKARNLSRELVEAVREFASVDHRAVNFTAREIAESPPIEAYNTYAFALYTLGDHAGALSIFKQHVDMARNQNAFADKNKHGKYSESSARLYAAEWIKRIEQNARQYFEILEFTTDSEGDFFGDWMQPIAPKNDLGFREITKMRGGKLILGVDQKESNIFSRLETERDYSTVTLFEADFVRISDVLFNRGIELTKTTAGVSGDSEPIATLFVGVNADGNIYYETRSYERKGKRLVEKQGDYGIIDPAYYGGVSLGKDERLRLAIRRATSADNHKMDYFVVINGSEVAIDITDKKLNSNDLATSKRQKHKLRCGFYTQAPAGIKGSVEIERVKLVYDGGLGGRKR